MRQNTIRPGPGVGLGEGVGSGVGLGVGSGVGIAVALGVGLSPGVGVPVGVGVEVISSELPPQAATRATKVRAKNVANFRMSLELPLGQTAVKRWQLLLMQLLFFAVLLLTPLARHPVS